MGLFIMSSNLVEQCFMDFNNILCENVEGPEQWTMPMKL